MKLKKTILFLFIAIIFMGYPVQASRKGAQNLNILLITIDTIRPDRIGCYSTKYLKTPNIDSLAEKGAVFDKAIAHNPMTLPSHANILLGATPLYHGVHDNSTFIVAEDFLTLAEYLKSNGYSTSAFIGAFPLDSRFGLPQGFDVYDDHYPSVSSYEFGYSERKAGKVIQSAISWLEKQNSRWFCWVHLWDPHSPYMPPEPFKSKFSEDPYSGEMAYVDSELKEIFDYVGSNNLTKNTVIILTGDHGESLGEHGELTHSYFAYNSTIWVPLIIAGPGIKAHRINEYVCHVDIFPTVCDILELKKPAFLQGVSLLPLIEGKKIKKRAIYFESLDAYYNRGWAPLRGFIEEGKKFIDSPLPEFYDLENDFDEEKNLVQKIDPVKYQKRMKEIKEEFSSHQNVQSRQRIDREARERLRSLGYVVSAAPQVKDTYGVEDDLKTLLPLQQRHSAAMSLYENGKVAESIKLLSEIIDERKDFIKAYIDIAQIYRSKGLIEEAFAVMEEALRNNPQSYSVVSSYGIFLVKQGKLDKGIEILQRGLELIDFDPESWTHIGIAYWRKGEYQKALEYYEKALSLDNTDAVIYNNLGTLYLSNFMQTKKSEDHTLAIENFKKAVELDPELASAYNGLGGAYKIAGQNDEAISVWEKSLELNPDYDFSIYNLGVAYLERGNKAKALKYFEKYLLVKNNKISPKERREIEELIKKCKQ